MNLKGPNSWARRGRRREQGSGVSPGESHGPGSQHLACLLDKLVGEHGGEEMAQITAPAPLDLTFTSCRGKGQAVAPQGEAGGAPGLEAEGSGS